MTRTNDFALDLALADKRQFEPALSVQASGYYNTHKTMIQGVSTVVPP